MVIYTIWGRYKNRGEEEIDCVEAKTDADAKANAQKVLAEYRMAFGPDWELWVEKEKE